MKTIETERGTITVMQKGEKMEDFKEKAKEFGKKAWTVTKKYAPYAAAVGCFYIFCDAIYKIGADDGSREMSDKFLDMYKGVSIIDNEQGTRMTALILKDQVEKVGTENFQLLLKRFPATSLTFDPTDIINF